MGRELAGSGALALENSIVGGELLGDEVGVGRRARGGAERKGGEAEPGASLFHPSRSDRSEIGYSSSGRGKSTATNHLCEPPLKFRGSSGWPAERSRPQS